MLEHPESLGTVARNIYIRRVQLNNSNTHARSHARKTLGYSRWRHIHDDKQKTKFCNGPAELTFFPLKYGCFPRQCNTFKELQKAKRNPKKGSHKILTFFQITLSWHTFLEGA